MLVKFFGTLRQDLGVDRVKLREIPRTLGDLIEQLASRYGPRVKEELLDEGGNLDYAYAIFIDGERAGDLSAPLRKVSEVVITGMLAGGKPEP